MPDSAEDDARDDVAPYLPTMSPEDVTRIRRWHERAYRAAQAEAGTGQTFDYLDLVLHVPPQVQPITGMSHLLGEAVLAEVMATDRVLDMGTGCGVNAILAASKASAVLAVDVNPHAVRAAQDNAARNDVEARVEVRHSDVFSAVEGLFDLIVFDPPFRWFPARDLLEAATTDENYRTLRTFFRQARSHLAPSGRILVFFGSTGDIDYLHQLSRDAGFSTHVVAQDEMIRDGTTVGYLTYRLTPIAQTAAHG